LVIGGTAVFRIGLGVFFAANRPFLAWSSRYEAQLMRHSLLAAFLLAMLGSIQAQHGAAPPGYYPAGFVGDTWKGEVAAVDDQKREITLVYRGQKKTETFVGVLQEGYKAKLKDSSLVELKVSTIPIGTRLQVYYLPTDRKINGRKEKFCEIFQVHFLP
jgi:hypothetical protein